MTNRDNHGTKVFYPEGNRIELEITKEEALFTGEFTVYLVRIVAPSTEYMGSGDSAADGI